MNAPATGIIESIRDAIPCKSQLHEACFSMLQPLVFFYNATIWPTCIPTYMSQKYDSMSQKCDNMLDSYYSGRLVWRPTVQHYCLEFRSD